MIKYSTFAHLIESRLDLSKVNFIAVDAPGSSGKTSFAKSLSNQFNCNSSVLHMDDFYFPNNPNKEESGYLFDWRRLEAQVLKPLLCGEKACYQTYDWDNWQDEVLGLWMEAHPAPIIICEGVTSMRAELRKYYCYKIFIHTPAELRQKRTLDRSDDALQTMNENVWLPEEMRYYNDPIHSPEKYADLVLSGDVDEVFRETHCNIIRSKENFI